MDMAIFIRTRRCHRIVCKTAKQDDEVNKSLALTQEIEENNSLALERLSKLTGDLTGLGPAATKEMKVALASAIHSIKANNRVLVTLNRSLNEVKKAQQMLYERHKERAKIMLGQLAYTMDKIARDLVGLSKKCTILDLDQASQVFETATQQKAKLAIYAQLRLLFSESNNVVLAHDFLVAPSLLHTERLLTSIFCKLYDNTIQT